MPVLHNFATKKNLSEKNLSSSEVFSIFYHNIFGYPLTFSELVRWTPQNAPAVTTQIDYKNGFYFVHGSEGLIYKRSIRKRFSHKKRKIAEDAAKKIARIASVKMIAISGSIAMENAKKGDDIDLIIVTKNGKLWTTRILVYLTLKIFGFTTRSAKSVKQQDRFCLNIWLDESDIIWNKRQRNFYTSHEILQLIPIVNKEGTYERFLSQNKWALNFWPNASEMRPNNNNLSYSKPGRINILERILYKIQYLYMKNKITREVISPTKAIFHPNDLSKKVIGKISP